jgi:hypothetical protein
LAERYAAFFGTDVVHPDASLLLPPELENENNC